jgi:hypothetical protein
MIDPREILFGKPALQKGTVLLFLGLHLILGGVVGLLLTHVDLFWALIALGAAVGCMGSFKLSDPTGSRT